MKNFLFSLCFILSALYCGSEPIAKPATQTKGWDVVLNFLYGQPPFTLQEREQLRQVLHWPKEFEDNFRNAGDNTKDSGITRYHLGEDQFLLQINGALNAYQRNFIYYFIDDKKEKFYPLQFKTVDVGPNNKLNIEKTTEVSGMPEFKNEKLTIFSKGRGAGGCGSKITYGFKEGQSYVIEAKARSCEAPMDAEGKMADPNKWPVVNIGK